ncbi:hypothetical protein Tco_0648241 [Tanacetum coccineum]
MKKRLGKKEFVSKQGRKNVKPGPTLDDIAFDNLDADLAHGIDYMDTKEAVNKGRQSKETEELNVTHDTEVLEKGGSNEEPVNVAGNIRVSTSVPEVTQLAMDEKVARQVNAELEEFDEIKERMNADTLLAKRLQEAEREQFTVEQRAKFLHDTIAAQRKFLAEQRAVAIRSKPLT